MSSDCRGVTPCRLNSAPPYRTSKFSNTASFKLKGLVTNYGEGGGGYKTGGGGAREVLPLRKGGAEKVLAMLEGGGHKKFWGSFYVEA